MGQPPNEWVGNGSGRTVASPETKKQTKQTKKQTKQTTSRQQSKQNADMSAFCLLVCLLFVCVVCVFVCLVCFCFRGLQPYDQFFFCFWFVSACVSVWTFISAQIPNFTLVALHQLVSNQKNFTTRRAYFPREITTPRQTLRGMFA